VVVEKSVFIKNGDIYTVDKRSETFTDSEILIDESVWGDYEYIGFNLSEVGTPVISDQVDLVASNLTLFRPK